MRMVWTKRFNGVLLIAMAWLSPVWVAADAVDDEYVKRLTSLSTRDVQGHLQLAKWCREKDKWQLVAERCNHILRIEANHQQAKLLLDIARARLGKQQQTVERVRGGPTRGGGRPRMLTDEQVQRIRRAEMYLDDRERVTLRIDRTALREFYDSAHRKGQIDIDRRSFFRLSRLEQAQLVLDYAAEKFGDKITVKSDPRRMRAYIRKVQPIVLRQCASAECHGGVSAGTFRLIGGRSHATNASYANFLIMHEYSVDGLRVINRDLPGRSLLLTYGLPSGSGEDAKPYNHPTDIAPIFPNDGDRHYQVLLDWLSSLSIDRPDYGIDLTVKK